MNQEKDEIVNVPWKCYWQLFTMSHGYLLLLLSTPFYTAYMAAGAYSNYIMAEWM